MCKIGIHSYPSIDNVLFVEGLKHKLLSISQLYDNGYDASLNKDECIVRNKDESLLFFAERNTSIRSSRANYHIKRYHACSLSKKIIGRA